MPSKNSNSMQAIQIMLAKANEVNTVDLDIYGKKITFSYKKMGWRSINKAISYAMEYSTEKDSNGQIGGKFRIDKYYTYALNEMIVNPPFPLTETFWDALPREAGVALESIIPNPFNVAEDMTEEIQESGKVSGDSYEEQ